jgi:hypothetical protein
MELLEIEDNNNYKEIYFKIKNEKIEQLNFLINRINELYYENFYMDDYLKNIKNELNNILDENCDNFLDKFDDSFKNILKNNIEKFKKLSTINKLEDIHDEIIKIYFINYNDINDEKIEMYLDLLVNKKNVCNQILEICEKYNFDNSLKIFFDKKQKIFIFELDYYNSIEHIKRIKLNENDTMYLGWNVNDDISNIIKINKNDYLGSINDKQNLNLNLNLDLDLDLNLKRLKKKRLNIDKMIQIKN